MSRVKPWAQTFQNVVKCIEFVQGGLSIVLCGGCIWEIGARAWSEGAVDWMCRSQDLLQLHVVLAATSKMFARCLQDVNNPWGCVKTPMWLPAVPCIFGRMHSMQQPQQLSQAIPKRSANPLRLRPVNITSCWILSWPFSTARGRLFSRSLLHWPGSLIWLSTVTYTMFIFTWIHVAGIRQFWWPSQILVVNIRVLGSLFLHFFVFFPVGSWHGNFNAWGALCLFGSGGIRMSGRGVRTSYLSFSLVLATFGMSDLLIFHWISKIWSVYGFKGLGLCF